VRTADDEAADVGDPEADHVFLDENGSGMEGGERSIPDDVAVPFFSSALAMLAGLVVAIAGGAFLLRRR
jgi:hypothetical protein